MHASLARTLAFMLKRSSAGVTQSGTCAFDSVAQGMLSGLNNTTRFCDVCVCVCDLPSQDATSVRLCCVVLRAIAPTLTTYRTSGNATTATCDRSVQDACEAVLSVMSNNVLGRDWYVRMHVHVFCMCRVRIVCAHACMCMCPQGSFPG